MQRGNRLPLVPPAAPHVPPQAACSALTFALYVTPLITTAYPLYTSHQVANRLDSLTCVVPPLPAYEVDYAVSTMFMPNCR